MEERGFGGEVGWGGVGGETSSRTTRQQSRCEKNGVGTTRGKTSCAQDISFLRSRIKAVFCDVSRPLPSTVASAAGLRGTDQETVFGANLSPARQVRLRRLISRRRFRRHHLFVIVSFLRQR